MRAYTAGSIRLEAERPLAARLRGSVRYSQIHRCPAVPRRQLVPLAQAGPPDAPIAERPAEAVALHEPPAPQQAQPPPQRKLRVVVVGSGWAGISFLKNVDPAVFGEGGPYELTMVSPRNYFLFTPLLPSAVSGTVEERSIVEPVRNLIHGKGQYYEAQCLDIDPQRRVLTCLKEFCEVCRARKGAGHSDADHTFEVPYDVLLLAVGSVNNTFGIKGVGEHCWFLKTIDEAHKLRVHISKAIEQAGLPTTTPEERRRLLSFVVVGGGPTGCELAAELHDLINEDVAKLFPHLKGDVRITLIETRDHLLNAYDRQIAEYAGKLFLREGIELKLNTSVLSVEEGQLRVQERFQEPEALEFGTCVWATGVGMHSLVRDLKGKLPAEVQTSPTGLVVDRFLRVKGAGGSILALGDAAVTNQDKAIEHAAALFEAASHHGTGGRLAEPQVLELLKKAQREYPQMSELVHTLQEMRWGEDANHMLHAAMGGGRAGPAQRMNVYTKHIERLQKGLTYDQFRELLADMDRMLRALPATAQVARQEGEYLARIFSRGELRLAKEEMQAAGTAASAAGEDGAAPSPAGPLAVELDPKVEPFQYVHLGSLAYLGMDRAVMQLPSAFPFKTLKGWLVGHAWRGLETFMQISTRNQLMVFSDWIRVKIFGRNLSDI